MDLGKIIEEIVPWVVLLGMFLPYLKKVRKAQRIAAAKPEDAAVAAKRRPAGSARPWKNDAMRITDTVRPRAKSSVIADTGVAPAHPFELPDEGIRATDEISQSGATVSGTRSNARRRDIRRALIWNEILNKKY